MFAIAWKNKIMSRTGFGYNKYPTQESAQDVCSELNRDYENFEHIPVEVGEDGKPLAKPLFACDQASPEEVAPLKDTDLMFFGPHCGKPMALVPADYLQFITGDIVVQQQHPQIVEYVRRNRGPLEEEAKQDTWRQQETNKNFTASSEAPSA